MPLSIGKVGGMDAITGAVPSADGRLGEGLSQVREATGAALDQDDNNYGKDAKGLEIDGRMIGTGLGSSMGMAKKVGDAGAKIGKAMDGGGTIASTFVTEGGVDGVRDTVGGAKDIGVDKFDTAKDTVTDTYADTKDRLSNRIDEFSTSDSGTNDDWDF